MLLIGLKLKRQDGKEFELQRVGKDSPGLGQRSRFHVALQSGALADFQFLIAVNNPAARVAMDRDWSKWRMKQLSLCGMMINATKPLAGRTELKTPQIIHDSSAGVTLHISHSPHITALVCSYPWSTEHQ